MLDWRRPGLAVRGTETVSDRTGAAAGQRGSWRGAGLVRQGVGAEPGWCGGQVDAEPGWCGGQVDAEPGWRGNGLAWQRSGGAVLERGGAARGLLSRAGVCLCGSWGCR
ncbi:hypothetical protein GCM10022222_76970 [Amycolatopsis ultiminotia]|uniref:Uncharacterized protein n=1 Tax=Amycolatopsis ultiminotia TaxID=543629 RepID=A0ABP6YDS5_9PSEU